MSPSHATIPVSQATPPFFVGIDLGATNIKIGLVDDLGRTLTSSHLATDVPAGPEAAAKRIGLSVLNLLAEVGLERHKIAGAGFGCPGPLDLATGTLLNPANLKGWENFPIRDRVSHHCGLPIRFANDACAAAYGEHWIGAGRAHKSLVLLTLGTGLGGGIVVDGILIEGHHGIGAYCGHIDHRLSRRCPALRLRPNRTSRGVRQRRGHGEAHGRSDGSRAKDLARCPRWNAAPN